MAELNHFNKWGKVIIESQGTRGKDRDGIQRMRCLKCNSRRDASVGNDNTKE